MKKILTLLATLASAAATYGAEPLSDMMSAFATPPDSARTKVWWFHGEQAPTKEGIAADLQAYRDAGIGGVVYYDQVHGSGEGAPELWSPAWWDALTFSALEARRLGLTFEINVGNGYVAGGAHITPDLAMKRLVMADTVVSAGSGTIRLPEVSGGELWSSDVAVIAVPAHGHTETRALTGVTRTLSLPGTSDTIYIDRAMTARAITYTTNARAKAAPSP